jgi:hypothetical protein
MISYDGRVFFGLAGDRDVLPDLDDLAAHWARRCASSGAAGEAEEEDGLEEEGSPEAHRFRRPRRG